MEKIKQNKKKIIHIAIIVLGILFISIPTFHGNLWFDEAYSVGIANRSFGEIWKIGGNDVHPVLYYWVLHFVYLIFGNKVIMFRIVSLVFAIILGIIGYTHVRKDFGENTGIIFSFLAYFYPLNVVYAGEIRMYTMAMLLVTLMAIYAYRIYKNKGEKNIKNWILFSIFSLASAYTHYYGLMAAGLVNLILFISFIIEIKKEKKFTYNMKAFLIQGVSEIVLYIPWVLSLLLQMKQVSNGFWIGIKFPDTLIEFFTFQFTGNLGGTQYISNLFAGIFGIALLSYMIYIFVKNKKDEELCMGKFAILVWLLVALGAIIVSLVIWRPIIYARYMLCVTGLFIFFIAIAMSKKGNMKINIIFMILMVVISVITISKLCEENYAIINKEVLNYLKENVQEGDIFLHANEGSGFVVATNYQNNVDYFYDRDHWSVEEAYKAFTNKMEYVYNLEKIDEYTGRIWVISSNNLNIYNEMKERYNEEFNVIDKKDFDSKYKNLQYTFILIEK